MITRIFLYIMSTSAALRRAVWKWWYQRLASFDKGKDWRFMNYGYAPIHGEMDLPLQEKDEENRFFIQLYHHTLSGVDLAGKNVLEVGSGRGGGADYVARYLAPAKIVGADLSKNAVELAKTFYDVPNLNFIVGDAERLPLENESFDVVYNVESSHCYGNMSAFVAEVLRVLKPGGVFVWTDIRNPEAMKKDDAVFENSGLTLLHKEEITSNVLRALEMFSDFKKKTITERTPWFVRSSFMEFAAVKGSEMFNSFKDGSTVYWYYRFQKPL